MSLSDLGRGGQQIGRDCIEHALVTRVLYRKRNEAKHFTIVDAAMNDLMRPALYGSFHPMQPVARFGGAWPRWVSPFL